MEYLLPCITEACIPVARSFCAGWEGFFVQRVFVFKEKHVSALHASYLYLFYGSYETCLVFHLKAGACFLAK